jgi:hypothetical protein
MKIDGITPAGKGGETPKKSETVTGPSFGSFLQDAMETGKAEKARASAMPSPVMPSQLVNTAVANPITREAMSQLETILGDLEMYLNSLSNADVPEGRLGPLSDSLMQKKDVLVGIMKHIDDPKLKDLISQTASLILSENTRLHSVGAV